MRILVLCDRYPFPLYNGQNLRIFHLARALREHHELDLVCYGEEEVPGPLSELFNDIRSWPAPATGPENVPQRLAGLVSPERMIPSNLAAQEYLGNADNLNGYDVIWMVGWEMVVNLPDRPGPPLVADIVDDGVLEHWRALRAARGIWARLRGVRRVLLNYLFERRFFCGADACVVVSERDGAVLSRVCPRTPVHVVHNGVDADWFAPGGADPRPATLVFEGAMGFPPNVAAARYLAREILPRIREQVPEAELWLVGRDPAPEVRELADEGVWVSGFVEDVRPYLDAATVFVCPMQTGAGIKNKVLQAWAMEKPVVGTAEAMGGLAAEEGTNVLLGRSPEELAEAVVGLLKDPGYRERLGREGRKTVLKRYTWECKSDDLDRILLAASAQGQGAVSHANT